MTIDKCSIPAGRYMRHLFSMFLTDNWLWMILPVAICAILAIWLDVRFIIVALMVLFIAMPMILSLLYFYYGFSPEARWSIIEKTIAIEREGATLTFTDERMKQHAIRWDDVREIIIKDDALLLMLKGKRYTCLMIPSSVVNPDVTQAIRQLVAQVH